MPERSVTVRISATDNFSTVVDRYQSKMGEAKTSTENMTSATDSSKSAMGQFTTAIKGVIGGLAVREVVNFGVEMTNLGREVNLTKQRFDALVTPMGDAEDIMMRLREASLGTATDQTLAEGSNLLMMTGIAKSPEDLEQIIGLITRTKKPTEDLNVAINNFSLMLANNSILRLDSYGISANNVRNRINELLDSGQALSRDQAFKMAVLEEGAKNIDRLGASAEAAGTPLTRLETTLENIKNQAASNIAIGVEGLIGIAEIAAGQNPIQQQQAQDAANTIAESFATAMDYAMKQQNLMGEDQNFISDFLTRAVDAAANNPSLASDATALRNAVLAQFGVFNPEAALGPGGGLNDMAGQINTLSQIAAQSVVITQQKKEDANTDRRIADETERTRAAQERLNQLYADVGGFLQGGVDTLTEWRTRAEDILFTQETFSNVLSDIEQQAQGIDFGSYATPEQAANAQMLAENAQTIVDQMKEIDKEDPFMFSDEQLSNAQDAANRVGDIADEAERAAAALANIKLTDIFGQTGGGVRGEVGDLLLQQMRDTGATPEQMAAFERQMNLSSGRETQGSLALKETIIPAIANITDDPEAMAQISSAIADVLVGAAQQGIDPNNPAFIQQLTGDVSAQGEGFDAETFLANFTDLSAQAETFNTSITEFLTSITGAQEPVGIVETAMSNISTYGQNLQTAMEKLTSKVQEVKVKVKVEYDDSKGWLEQTVKNNGGRVPGATMN